MTTAARISQSDMERATKAVAAAGFERAHIVMDLEARKIEIFVGESPATVPVRQPETWSDDDV